MRTWLYQYWDSLRTTFWFLPALMAITAVVLAIFCLELDRAAGTTRDAGWTYTGGPEGARAVLSTIAGSMITVGGVVFSITIVSLSLASGQFGPRLLRNFIRDRSNQFVLGTFTSTFIYCLLVLRTVRGTDLIHFVPGISVTIGIILALASLGVLIYFIHHVAVSIQVTQVIALVTQELRETIDRLWPEDLGLDPPPAGTPDNRDTPVVVEEDFAKIAATSSGYLDAINDESLLRLAVERNLLVRLARRPGHFIVKGTTLASVRPADRVDEDLSKQINRLHSLSPHRSPFQDVEFAIDQLVEIAVRALSPGINDPFTAMACIDHLGAALSQLAQRPVPSNYRYDDEKQLRIITHPTTFRSIADSAFNQIRQYGCGSTAVLIRMLETLAVIANHADRDEDRAALREHADLIHRASVRGLPEKEDRKDVDERFTALLATLQDQQSAS